MTRSKILQKPIAQSAASSAQENAGMPSRWLALPFILLGVFLPVLDFFIVNVTLPFIRADLRASGAELQLIMGGYAAAYALSLVTGGRLGDLWGRKRLFLGGMLGFTMASAMCGLSTSAPFLIVARILQGTAAAIMAPQVLAMIKTAFPADEQPIALALLGVSYSAASVTGLVLSGVLVHAALFGLTWQPIFLINIPVGIIGILGGTFLVRESRASLVVPVDIPGVLAFGFALILLAYPLIQGREAGWPVWTLAMLVASPIAFWIFMRVETALIQKGGVPLVDFALFRNRSFCWGLVAAFLFYNVSSFFLTFSLYLEDGLGLDSLTASKTFVLFGVGWFFGSIGSAPLRRVLGRSLLNYGAGLMPLGLIFVLIGVIFTKYGIAWRAIGLATFGFGQGLFMPSLILEVMSTIPFERAGLASGVLNTTMQLGTVFFVAALGTVFFAHLGLSTAPQYYREAFAATLPFNLLFLFLAFGASVGLIRNTAVDIPR